MSQVPDCKWGDRCYRDDCKFLHHRINIECEYGPNCKKQNCWFNHKFIVTNQRDNNSENKEGIKQNRVEKDIYVHFLIDVSGSMSGLRIEQTKIGVSSIISELRDNDLINISTFSDNLIQVCHNVHKINFDNSVLNNLNIVNQTRFYDSVITILESFKRSNRTNILIIISDGADNLSIITPEMVKERIKQVKNLRIFALSLDDSSRLMLSQIMTENKYKKIIKIQDGQKTIQRGFVEIVQYVKSQFRVVKSTKIKTKVRDHM
jgi:uncharacterized protein with von Willebrand factor type A (vWA) domain